MNCKTHMLPWGTPLYYVGPDLNEGPLPAFFYFSLAGDESLCLDPYNQPAAALQDKPLRIFSMTLPGHGDGFDKHKAIAYWAEQMGQGHRLLEEFVQEASKTVDYLIAEKIASKVAVGGLSRGAFIATHLAIANPQVIAVVGFAPLTDLTIAKDFAPIKKEPQVEGLTLKSHVGALTGRPVRFYIGNRDMLVGTENACHFILQLANASYNKQIRSPAAELIIGPSIGAKGHGTSPETFRDGSAWIWEKLSSS